MTDSKPNPLSTRPAGGEPTTANEAPRRLSAWHWGRLYFYSGWAFLIPYLGAYLLYAWAQWPVNAPPIRIAGAGGMGPTLLQVYWGLHAIHAVLAVIVLYRWGTAPDREKSPGADLAGASRRFLDCCWPALPWLCLAMFFWLPGVYLEFPSDPWHHFARTNEWGAVTVVTDHSAWKKFSYAIAYSLIGGFAPPLAQLRAFDLYYTGCCLLLSWQYYRLARTLGFGQGASFLFVVVNALTFGNNLFGFYRYYGMSSTLFSQLGAVALTRIACASLPPAAKADPARGQRRRDELDGPSRAGRRATIAASLRVAPATITLLAFITFNHIQGLGIAALGLAAVAVWWMTAARRIMLLYLAAAGALLSIGAVLFWPRHPSLQSVYLAENWMTSWYGFNFFSGNSPAFTYALGILGFAGVLNLLAAVVLVVRSNSLAGWLTLVPVGALCLPVFALPFATVLEDGLVFTFNRVLLATPAGLAIIGLVVKILKPAAARVPVPGPGHLRSRFGIPVNAAYLMLLTATAAFCVVPSAYGYFNRLYHGLVIPPHDLSMHHILRAAPKARPPHAAAATGTPTPLPGIAYVLNATGQTQIPGARKWMTWPRITAPSLNVTLAGAGAAPDLTNLGSSATFRPLTALYSAGSDCARLSHHWLPYEVALEHAAQRELFGAAHEPASRVNRRSWAEK